MTETSQTPKRLFDLEERTLHFSKDVAKFCKLLSADAVNREYITQVIRSSGSVGANYIEANEALSKKDFMMRIKICRKEAKETIYWLTLIAHCNEVDKQISAALIQEATELKKIFSSLLKKANNRFGIRN